jgi:hypothetical protein
LDPFLNLLREQGKEVRQKKYVVIALVVLAAVSLLLVVFTHGSSVNPFKSDIAATSPHEQSSQALETQEISTDAASQKKISVDGYPFPLLKRNRKDLALTEDLFGPQSREEQAWLDRNGYPTRDQVETYSSASDAELEQAARLGDKVAEVFLNQRNLMKGDSEAESRLIDQAAKGTTYALLGMAGYYAGSKTANDPMKAYAYTRAIEMLGDQKMGLTRDFILHGQLDPRARFEAEALSIKTYNEIVRRRRLLLGPSAPIVDPRPVVQPEGSP